MIVIYLTPAQADAVRGETSPGYGLEPVPYGGEGFVLPASVLNDHAHASVHPFLVDLPRIEFVPEEAADEAL